MRHLNNQFYLPWLCTNDLNEVLFENEKRGEIHVKLGICKIFMRLFQIVVYPVLTFLGISTQGLIEGKRTQICKKDLTNV